MKLSRGLTTKMIGMKDGKIYFNVTATKFYLFKVILKIAGQQIRKPVIACLITMYAFYFLIKNNA